MITLILFISIGYALGFPADAGNERIIGGQLASEGQFPYQISFRDKNHVHICGGSILSSRWILTAAHCVRGMSQYPFMFEVKVGSVSLSEGGSIYDVAKIIIHPEDNPNKKHNDLALIQTASDIQFTENVRKIEIGEVKDNEKVVLSGWGFNKFPGQTPDKLNYINLSIYPQTSCAAQWMWYFDITTKQVCTLTKRGEGACGGDSGGPLVNKETGKLVGVVSFGRPCGVGWPDVYTRASSYEDWVNDTINK